MSWLDFLLGRSWRRRKLLSSPFPSEWERHLEDVAFYPALEPAEKEKLRNDLRILVHEKHWEGCSGFEVTDHVRVVVAAQAALLLLHLERHDYYARTHSILIYPSDFMIPAEDRPAGEGGFAATGLAMHRGPIALAWDECLQGGRNRKDGRNVVLHEFAHKLDMMDQLIDGTPPIRDRAHFAEWIRVMTAHFERLNRAADTGKRTILVKYGATNPGEFFAVATEAFFEKPWQLKEKHSDLYGVLSEYYRQDPARWAR